MKFSDIKPAFTVGQNVFQHEAAVDCVYRGKVTFLTVRMDHDGAVIQYGVRWAPSEAIDVVDESQLTAYPVFPEIVEAAQEATP